ncbi:hypothetical protein DSO57_1035710 [Entomophthora muscae]|uniref:Uncharacterized protein n=1 Tax=Entomophthora muscae TaxID=34485 RepID=A0ACC2REB3_9FUNG|nr:hypothetical protein DSO57_1035710 [Entomophthora muscae]
MKVFAGVCFLPGLTSRLLTSATVGLVNQGLPLTLDKDLVWSGGNQSFTAFHAARENFASTSGDEVFAFIVQEKRQLSKPCLCPSTKICTIDIHWSNTTLRWVEDLPRIHPGYRLGLETPQPTIKVLQPMTFRFVVYGRAKAHVWLKPIHQHIQGWFLPSPNLFPEPILNYTHIEPILLPSGIADGLLGFTLTPNA